MRERQSGITLIEVMVTVAIIAIIATIAVPSYQDMIEKSRLREAVQSVKSDLQIARSEAFKRSANISVDFDAGRYCYGVGTLGADTTGCDCVAPDCTELKTVTTFDQVTLSSGTDGTIEFRRGTTGGFSANLTTTKFVGTVGMTTTGLVEFTLP